MNKFLFWFLFVLFVSCRSDQSAEGGDGTVDQGGEAPAAGEQQGGAAGKGGTAPQGEGPAVNGGLPAVVNGEVKYALFNRSNMVKTLKIYVRSGNEAKSIRLGWGECLLLKAGDFELLRVDWGYKVGDWGKLCSNDDSFSYPNRCGQPGHYNFNNEGWGVAISPLKEKPAAETSNCKTLS